MRGRREASTSPSWGGGGPVPDDPGEQSPAAGTDTAQPLASAVGGPQGPTGDAVSEPLASGPTQGDDTAGAGGAVSPTDTVHFVSFGSPGASGERYRDPSDATFGAIVRSMTPADADVAGGASPPPPGATSVEPGGLAPAPTVGGPSAPAPASLGGSTDNPLPQGAPEQGGGDGDEPPPDGASETEPEAKRRRVDQTVLDGHVRVLSSFMTRAPDPTDSIWEVGVQSVLEIVRIGATEAGTAERFQPSVQEVLASVSGYEQEWVRVVLELTDVPVPPQLRARAADWRLIAPLQHTRGTLGDYLLRVFGRDEIAADAFEARIHLFELAGAIIGALRGRSPTGPFRASFDNFYGAAGGGRTSTGPSSRPTSRTWAGA